MAEIGIGLWEIEQAMRMAKLKRRRKQLREEINLTHANDVAEFAVRSSSVLFEGSEQYVPDRGHPDFEVCCGEGQLDRVG